MRRDLFERFGWERVYQGGFASSPTIEPALQRAAEAVARSGLDEIERRPDSSIRSAAPLPGSAGKVATDAVMKEGERGVSPGRAGPRSTLGPGSCGPMVGAARLERAASTAPCRPKRQSGSAFKPFVYCRAALEAGYSPASVINPPE